MDRKIAIVLRGAPCCGKSSVSNSLQEYFGLPLNSHVVLDHFWGRGEKRFAGHYRYWDLRDQPDVLLIELGYGEPDDPTFFGATRNPREWVSLLEADGRRVFFFLLEIDKAECIRRETVRKKLNPSYSAAAWDRYAPGGPCNGNAFFPLAGPGYLETPIDTQRNDITATVGQLLAKVGTR